MLVDQLEHIPVTGHRQHLPALGAGPPPQGGDHVIRFESLLLQLGYFQDLQEVLQERELGRQQVGSAGPLRLVFGEQVRTEGLSGHIPDHRQGVGVLIGQQPDEHAGETEHRVGHLA